jgi:hypothetical protein
MKVSDKGVMMSLRFQAYVAAHKAEEPARWPFLGWAKVILTKGVG